MLWSPDKYLQFEKERKAPFYDLLKLIELKSNLSVIDLGCGTGHLTSELQKYLPDSQVIGLDQSPEMLDKALPLSHSQLHFKTGRCEDVKKSYQLVFSHAMIQWIDNHSQLIPFLFSLVAPQGQLAIQLPSNHTHPTHTCMIEVAQEEPFHSALKGWYRQSPVLTIEAYANLLYKEGAKEIQIYEKIYPQIVPEVHTLLEWVSGTALLPYMERLPFELKNPFKETYSKKLSQYLPDSPIFYGFKRILFSAKKATK